MNILILGSGAREHALAWKIAQSPQAGSVFVTPGNPGTAEIAQNVELDLSNHHALAEWCRDHSIELVVVGPDQLIADGIVDSLSQEGIRAFGPTKAAAEIEWSKAYAKGLMHEEGIPTAASATFTDFTAALSHLENGSFPVVIKASGLASGKGVTIAQNPEEGRTALVDAMVDARFGAAGAEVVIEEYLEGTEISIHALCTGEEVLLFPAAQDHKRAYEGDTGPNTGGMGTVAPVPGISPETLEEIRTRIIIPTLRALAKRGRPFSGLLFPGIMLTSKGPKVIEFNARFGDPETQSYMRLLAGDILPVLLACAKGSLQDVTLEWSKGYAACIVLASGGYPSIYEKGKIISGLSKGLGDGIVVFHAGTMQGPDGVLLSNGGRVLGVTAVGATLQKALDSVYAGIREVFFDGMQYRKDIGARAVRGSSEALY